MAVFSMRDRRRQGGRSAPPAGAERAEDAVDEPGLPGAPDAAADGDRFAHGRVSGDIHKGKLIHPRQEDGAGQAVELGRRLGKVAAEGKPERIRTLERPIEKRGCERTLGRRDVVQRGTPDEVGIRALRKDALGREDGCFSRIHGGILLSGKLVE